MQAFRLKQLVPAALIALGLVVISPGSASAQRCMRGGTGTGMPGTGGGGGGPGSFTGGGGGGGAMASIAARMQVAQMIMQARQRQDQTLRMMAARRQQLRQMALSLQDQNGRQPVLTTGNLTNTSSNSTARRTLDLANLSPKERRKVIAEDRKRRFEEARENRRRKWAEYRNRRQQRR